MGVVAVVVVIIIIIMQSAVRRHYMTVLAFCNTHTHDRLTALCLGLPG